MSSKGDYLRRYADSGPSDEPKPRKRARAVQPNAMRVVDDDVDLAGIIRGRPDEIGEDAGDDAPAFVAAAAAVAKAAPAVPAGRPVDWDVLDDGRGDSPSPPRRRAADASPPRRQPGGSAPARRDPSESPPRRKPAAVAPPRRDDSPSPPRRQPGGSAASAGGPGAPAPPRMLGGGHAGLHSGASFRLEQRAQRAAAGGSGSSNLAADPGATAATVYRDKDGRLVDMEEKVARDKALAAALVAAKVVERHEWGRGTVQKRAAAAEAEEFASVAAAPLARRADDAALEAHLKARARDGDPMAGLVQSQQQPGHAGDTTAAAAAPAVRRRVYTGPPPPPNRYGIAPGYRWDGVDRSNGWEAKLIAYKASRASRAESEYHGRIADM